jgi:integrase/recombinase XerD
MRWKPKNVYEHRLYAILLTLLDTGCRIDEVLSLRTSDIDMENLLLCITGKGRTQRRIPFSFELRRVLLRYADIDGLLFRTRDGRKLGRRNILRDVKSLCKRLGFVPPERTLHAGIRSQSTICAGAEASSIFRKFSDIRHWR